MATAFSPSKNGWFDSTSPSRQPSLWEPPAVPSTWHVMPVAAKQDSTKALLPPSQPMGQEDDLHVTLTHVVGATDVTRRHVFVVEGRFTRPVMLSRIDFKNHNAAFVTCQVRPVGVQDAWFDVVPRTALTSHPHHDGPAMQARYTLCLRDHLQPITAWPKEQEITAFRCIAEQPSPNWQEMGLKDIQCYRFAKIRPTTLQHANRNEAYLRKAEASATKPSTKHTDRAEALFNDVLDVAQLARILRATLNQSVPVWELGVEKYDLSYLCAPHDHGRTPAWKSSRPKSARPPLSEASSSMSLESTTSAASRSKPRPATAGEKEGSFRHALKSNDSGSTATLVQDTSSTSFTNTANTRNTSSSSSSYSTANPAFPDIAPRSFNKVIQDNVLLQTTMSTPIHRPTASSEARRRVANLFSQKLETFTTLGHDEDDDEKDVQVTDL